MPLTSVIFFAGQFKKQTRRSRVMKNFIVPFMAMTLLMVSDASAQCAGGYGTGFGFQSNNCNFASSLWTDYCNGGPTMPASARACGCGCNLFSRNGCGGGCGGGLMSHVHGLLGRLGSGGSGSCCGSSWGGYNYPGYTVQGFGAYAGTVPYFGNPGCGSTWWYGGGSYGRSCSLRKPRLPRRIRMSDPTPLRWRTWTVQSLP